MDLTHIRLKIKYSTNGKRDPKRFHVDNESMDVRNGMEKIEIKTKNDATTYWIEVVALKVRLSCFVANNEDKNTFSSLFNTLTPV